ncbi:MAG: hypothetical protein ACQEXX_20965 [Bacillota bacterium]
MTEKERELIYELMGGTLPQTVECLYKTAQTQFEYLEYDGELKNERSL